MSHYRWPTLFSFSNSMMVSLACTETLVLRLPGNELFTVCCMIAYNTTISWEPGQGQILGCLFLSSITVYKWIHTLWFEFFRQNLSNFLHPHVVVHHQVALSWNKKVKIWNILIQTKYYRYIYCRKLKPRFTLSQISSISDKK